MYERFFQREPQPQISDFVLWCEEAAPLFEKLHQFMSVDWKADSSLRFPYGKEYGLGMKYAIGKKHICDVFAEKGAYTVMFRLSYEQFNAVYGRMTPYTQNCIDHKYPCGEGGWLHYRVTEEAHLQDVEQLLLQKMEPAQKKKKQM